jgi:serine/threonine-protein kinase
MIGTVLSNRYRLEAKLGSGGMSTVFLSRDEVLDRAVAVKLMHEGMIGDPDQLERFNQEARAVAKLSNPNVVAVIDAGEDGGRPYIVFEYVKGETLKQRIGRIGALDATEALAYAIEVAQALEVAHDRGMVHRDVKPQNVLIDSTGRAKLTDFGISRQLDEEGMTGEGKVIGTTDYVAPEQAMGQPVDPRSDVYSLGIVLFEMLTGDVPFQADSQVGVAMKHIGEEIPDVQKIRPDVSAATASTIDRATAKEPGERYQNVSDMADEMRAALEVEAIRQGGTGSEATSILDAVPPPARQLPTARTSPWPAALMLLIALVIAAGSAWVIARDEPSPGGDGSAPESTIPIVTVEDFDPEGDLVEHPEEVSRTIDGDRTTSAWTSETYQTNSFGLKSGVGLALDTGLPVTAKAIDLTTPTPGWSLEIYGSNDPRPDDVSSWDAIGSSPSVSQNQRIELVAPRPYRYFLLWATTPVESGNGYGVAISDVKIIG